MSNGRSKIDFNPSRSMIEFQNGNFLVRQSENKTAKYTITLWFNRDSTHIRVCQLSNGRYQLHSHSDVVTQMPVGFH